MEKTIVNFRWVFFVCIFSILIFFGVYTFSSDEMWISVSVISIGILLILGYAFLFPNSYTFSSNGLTVRYCFGLKTFLRWQDIRHIEDRYAGRKVFPWWREYEIGYFDTKIIFHQTALLPKNRKITKQIEQYYHKKI